MRKIIITGIVFIFTVGTVFAQTEGTAKKKRVVRNLTEILPKAGDFALGLDMAQFIKSINNSITNAAAGNTVTAFRDDFFGRYFVTDRQALRIRFGMNIHNATVRRFVSDDAANLLNPVGSNLITEAKTVDEWKQKNTTLELGIGYEYRRSLWRVQGYAGGEVFGGLNMQRSIFTYGNPMTATNQTPSTTTWLGWSNDPVTGAPKPNTDPMNTGSYRGLEAKAFGFTAGAALFIGADFFISRNISIGAEFDLEGKYERWNEQTMKTETWIVDKAYTAEEKIKPISSNFGLNPIGRLNLMITICGRKKNAPTEIARQEVVTEVKSEPEVVKQKEEVNKPCYTIEEMSNLIRENKNIVGKKICAVKQINFEFGKSTLTKSDKEYLSQIVDLMKKNEQLRIKINGHTDNVGSEEYNMNLSKNRSKAVYDYLIKSGISSKRLSYEYFGPSKPITDNDTEEGRATNRRVEFEIMNQN